MDRALVSWVPKVMVGATNSVPAFSAAASAAVMMASGAFIQAAMKPVIAGTKIRAISVETFLLMIRASTATMVTKPRTANILISSIFYICWIYLSSFSVQAKILSIHGGQEKDLGISKGCGTQTIFADSYVCLLAHRHCDTPALSACSTHMKFRINGCASSWEFFASSVYGTDQNTCFSCRALSCSSVMPNIPLKISSLSWPSWGAGVRTEGLVPMSLTAQPLTVIRPRVG